MAPSSGSRPLIVVALGGNALGHEPDEQLRLLRTTAPALADLAASGRLVVAHGNGPQVGQITRAFSLGAAADPGVPAVDLPEMVAMSQGYIGEHLVRALDEALTARGRAGAVAGLLTRVVVDPSDPAFEAPSKPIGQFLTAAMAERRRREDPSHVYGEDAGRGFRRLVASPEPQEICEIGAVKALVVAGLVVVASGGGGVPVVREGATVRAVDAVIDKDFSAALLASALGASDLVICTAVPRVAIGWGTGRQKWLKSVDSTYGRALIDAGEFAAGSMLPKVEAALRFVEGAPSGRRRAIICSLAEAGRALSGEVGTIFTR